MLTHRVNKRIQFDIEPYIFGNKVVPNIFSYKVVYLICGFLMKVLTLARLAGQTKPGSINSEKNVIEIFGRLNEEGLACSVQKEENKNSILM